MSEKKLALWVNLHAKAGKEAEAEEFLKQGAGMAADEPETLSWYAIRMSPGHYGVFDTFADESGREAHLKGEIAKALGAKWDELFEGRLEIDQPMVLSAK